jgi:hypothetical protein
VVFSADKTTEVLFGHRRGRADTYIERGGSIPRSVPESEDGRGAHLPGRPARDAAADIRAARTASSHEVGQDERANSTYLIEEAGLLAGYKWRAHPRVATAVAGRLAADDGAVAAAARLGLRAPF